MFPTGQESYTLHGQSGNLLSAFREGELSPPHSQDQVQQDVDEAMDLRADDETMADDVVVGDGERELRPRGSTNGFEAGASWTNPKAREEYARAYELLLDKKFTLSE